MRPKLISDAEIEKKNNNIFQKWKFSLLKIGQFSVVLFQTTKGLGLAVSLLPKNMRQIDSLYRCYEDPLKSNSSMVLVFLPPCPAKRLGCEVTLCAVRQLIGEYRGEEMELKKERNHKTKIWNTIVLCFFVKSFQLLRLHFWEWQALPIPLWCSFDTVDDSLA